MTYKIIDNDKERCVEYLTSQGLHHFGCESFIGLEQDGEMIACSWYGGYNGKSIQQHISAKKNRAVCREWVEFIAYYPFIQLGVNMLIGIINAKNEECRLVAKRFGYEEQYTIKGAAPEDDLIIMVLHKEKCKWLKR